MKRTYLILMNPIAGIKRKKDLRETLKTAIQKLGWKAEFVNTTPDGTYSHLRKRIPEEGITDVIIVGGDGTIRSVLSALHDLPLRFGLIPTGSGNGLARSAGLPLDPNKALEVIETAHTMKIDAFRVNGLFSCMLAGLGMDAQVAHDFAAAGTRGLSTYARLTWRNFWKASPYPFEVTIPRGKLNTQAYFISIANSNQFGNNVTIAPRARLNDGLLDVVIVHNMSKWHMVMSLLQQLRFGDIRESMFRESGISYFQTSSIHIRNMGDAPLHLDGDPFPLQKELQIEVLPSAISLITPG